MFDYPDNDNQKGRNGQISTDLDWNFDVVLPVLITK